MLPKQSFGKSVPKQSLGTSLFLLLLLAFPICAQEKDKDNKPAGPPALKVYQGREIAQKGGLPAGEIEAFDRAVRGRYETDL